MDVLRVQLISKSQSDQRAGRAGREFDGAVYRLYTRKDYVKMEEFPPPEILRSKLSRVLLLAAVSLGITNFKKFSLPDRPTDKVAIFCIVCVHCSQCTPKVNCFLILVCFYRPYSML